MRLLTREALLSFRRAPLLSALSITTIAFSLFTLGLFGLVAINLREALRGLEERVEIVAFVLRGTPAETITIATEDIDGVAWEGRCAPAGTSTFTSTEYRDDGSQNGVDTPGSCCPPIQPSRIASFSARACRRAVERRIIGLPRRARSRLPAARGEWRQAPQATGGSNGVTFL